jgi:hypothetical protein
MRLLIKYVALFAALHGGMISKERNPYGVNACVRQRLDSQPLGFSTVGAGTGGL